MEDDYKVAVDPADSAEEEAAFENAFNGTDEQLPVAEEPKEEPVVEEKEEPVATEQPAQTEEEPAKALTIDDILAKMEAQRLEDQKKLDKAFGKIGDLQHKIESARVSATGISSKARERLEAEFPELAEMLFDKDAPAQEVPQYQPPVVDNSDAVEEVKQTFEKKLLKVYHPDWETTVKTPEFMEWRSNVLPPEDAVQLAETWDSDYVASKLTEYKAYQAKQAKLLKDKLDKDKRLISAITPRGVQRQTNDSYSDDDEDSAMMASFKAR